MFAGDTLTDATAGARNILFIHCLGVAFVAVSNGSRVEIDVGVLFYLFFCLTQPACSAPEKILRRFTKELIHQLAVLVKIF
jgi:hypothetical protein